MKKIYLSLFAVAALFAGCSQNDILVDNSLAEQTSDQAIRFESFHQAATRATENNNATYAWEFFDHQTTFQVWGYKNTSETAVFNGDVVTVAEPEEATPRKFTYTYTPLRFWDKAATTYEYYAAAPSDPYDESDNPGGWKFNLRDGFSAAAITAAAGQDKGFFTTSSTLTGTNLSAGTTPTYTYVASFKTAGGDVDKLIAAPKTVANAQFSNSVELNFIHILSRLNVTIRKAEVLEEQTVIVKNLKVYNLLKAGDFDESKAAAATAGNNTRWTTTPAEPTADDYLTYAAPVDQEVTAVLRAEGESDDVQYLIQSLVIPQNAAFESVALDGAAKNAVAPVYYSLEEYNELNGTELDEGAFEDLTPEEKTKTPGVAAINAISATSKPYLVITYTIQDQNGDEPYPAAEEFTAYFNLAAAFGMDGTTTADADKSKLAFNEGWQNTLNITLNPDLIEFCAKVAEWSTVEETLEVK